MQNDAVTFYNLILLYYIFRFKKKAAFLGTTSTWCAAGNVFGIVKFKGVLVWRIVDISMSTMSLSLDPLNKGQAATDYFRYVNCNNCNFIISILLLQLAP